MKMRISLALALLVASTPSFGAISGTAVQCADSSTNTVSTVTIGSGSGWSTPQQAGNIIVIFLSVRTDGADTHSGFTQSGDATGFTRIEEYVNSTGSGAGGALWVARSDGTETSFTVGVTGGIPLSMRGVACEFDGTDLNPGYLASGQVTTSASSSATSLAGPSVTNDEPNALSLQFFAPSRGNDWNPPSYTNSYVEQFAQDITSSIAATTVTSKVVSTSGSNTTTISTTDTGSTIWAAGLVINENGTAISDTFTDANDTSIDAHAPDIDEMGGGWTEVSGCDVNFHCSIQNNTLQLSNAFNAMVIDSGQTSYTITVDWTTVQRNVRIFFRSDGTDMETGSGNAWKLEFDTLDTNEVQLYRIDSGVDTLIDDASLDTLTSGDELKVIVTPSSISGQVNSTEYVSSTDTTYSSNTYVGLGEGPGTSNDYMDNFLVVYAAAGSVAYDQDSYNLGDTISMTPTGFGSAITTITEQAQSDVLNVDTNQATACTLAQLAPSGICDNTELNVSLTWRASDGTTTADDTFITTTGLGMWSGDLACVPSGAPDCPNDSLAEQIAGLSGIAQNDGYLIRATSGTINTCDTNMVCEFGSSNVTVEVRYYDQSAVPPAWQTAVTQDFAADAPGVPVLYQYYKGITE